MQEKLEFNGEDRRDFLKTMMAGGACLGLGCSGLAALESFSQETGANQLPQKFKTSSGYSYEQVFNFAFGSWFIPYMKGLQAEIGREKFLNLLQTVGDQLYRDSVKVRFDKIAVKDVRSLIDNFWEPTRKARLWGTCLTIDILKKLPDSGTVKINDCLIAKVFRESKAGDIGYAAICHADFAVAGAFNPEIKLARNRCLMWGDDCCLFEYSR